MFVGFGGSRRINLLGAWGWCLHGQNVECHGSNRHDGQVTDLDAR